MSQAPYMPLFPDAMLGGTLRLSTEQFGAYCLLLFATWSNNGKPLPDDDAGLARICRCTPARWRQKLRPLLIDFFDISDGFLHQKRLEKEWEYVAAKRAAGALGGKASALKRQQTPSSKRPSNGQAGATNQTANETSSPIPIPIPRKKVSKKDSPPLMLKHQGPPPSPPTEPTAQTMHRASGDAPNNSPRLVVEKSHARGTRLPADWQPSPADCQFAAARGLDPGEIADEFADYWQAEPDPKGRKLNWSATYRNWCRRTCNPYSRGDRPGGLSIAAALSRVRLAGDD